jgi:hypothetical protein
MLRLGRPLITPERLYMAALGLSGLAAVCSIALAPAERGLLVASMAGATLGSAIGGISVDTFLMSRPKGWVWGRGAPWILAIVFGCVLLSGAVAALVIAVAGIGSYVVGIGAAGCLTIFNACSSLALRMQRFRFVYSVRATAGAALIVGYGWFYLHGQLGGLTWGTAYLAAQALAALTLGVAVVRWALRTRPEVPGELATQRTDLMADLSAMTKLHIGVSAQMVTSRTDQILLARLAGAGSLGVYALAVAALEFAQAGAVVRSQKILTNRDQAASIPKMTPVVTTTLPVAVFSVVALGVVGFIRPEYHQAWILGLLLLPGSIAAALGKTWSAALLIRRGETAASAVSVLSAVVAVPAYYVFVSWQGAIGAALAMSGAYAVYAAGAYWSLRTQSRTLAERVV